jgi:hypothetical protein
VEGNRVAVGLTFFFFFKSFSRNRDSTGVRVASMTQ